MSPGADAVTDGDLRAYLKVRLGTSYHGTGTCRMGIGDDAVTDAKGRVHGVQGLRVVDASIMPKNVLGRGFLAQEHADYYRAGRDVLSLNAGTTQRFKAVAASVSALRQLSSADPSLSYSRS